MYTPFAPTMSVLTCSRVFLQKTAIGFVRMTDTPRAEVAEASNYAAIPCIHPEWGPDDLVKRATELVPILRSRLGQCEFEGRIPEATNDDFLEAGFYRILQPRIFGGYEFGMETFVKVMIEVARGCPSSGWVLSLTAGHAIALSAFFSEQAQVEVYGDGGDFRGPSSMAPRPGAQGIPVEGGFLVSGEWDYASGIDISTHYFAGIVIPHGDVSEDEVPDLRIALLNRQDYSIVDNWKVMGMRGTGSRRVVAKDVFVPSYRAIVPPRDAFTARNSPGRSVHSNPVYCTGRLTSVLLEEMAAVAVGTAKGMLDMYERDISPKPQRVAGRGVVLGTSRSDSPVYQRHFGEAWALVHMAEATILKVAADYTEYARQDAEEGIPFSDERDQQLQVLEQYATKLAVDAVDLMFRTGGTSSAQEGSALQRYFRDMSVLSTHNGAQYDRGAEALGKAHFTREVETTTDAV